MLYLDCLNTYLLHISVLFCSAVFCDKKICFRIFSSCLIAVAALLLQCYFDQAKAIFWISVLVIEAVIAFEDGMSAKMIILCIVIYFVSVNIIEMLKQITHMSATCVCAVLLLIGYSVMTLKSRMLKIRKKENLYIRTARGEKTIKVLADSGNLLKVQNGRRHVVIVRAEDVKSIAPKSALYALGLCDENDDTEIYPIAYKTVGGSGILYGFIPQKCEIKGREFECMIGLCAGNDMFSGDCSALCNPYILEV